ncbi:MAG: methyl-accepting chemotaxis protein [Pseudomonadota bacterium]|nr:methyl-accepting chemotaxis protein [Pseudomonadota bacterium]
MDINIRKDRFLLLVLGLSLLLSLGLASWYNTWMEALVIGVLSVGGAFAISGMAPGTLLSRMTNAIALMVMVALQIHQARGMIEMHFGVFVGLALLYVYLDWRPLVLGAGLIAVHHVLFNLLQQQGAPVWVFDNDRLGWNIVFIHAVYVVVETAALVWLALMGRQEARVSEEVIRVSSAVHREDGTMDLSLRCDDSGNSTLRQFNAMMSQVERVVVDTKMVMEELVTVIRHSNSANQKLNKLSDEKVHLTEQIAVAMEQLAQSVVSISDNAQNTSHSTDQAVTDNRACLEHVKANQVSVHGLSDSLSGAGGKIEALAENCKAISAVVDVIQGIAEQTNLLALNAAIEAARAGEQGRGFAVVADEVRALASRTYDSTEEINNLVQSLQSVSEEAVSAMEDCRSRVKDTESHSTDVLDRLTVISGGLDEVGAMVQQIAAAVEQQSAVSREVSHNANEIKQSSHEVSNYAREGLQDVQRAEDLVSALDKKLNAFRVG